MLNYFSTEPGTVGNLQEGEHALTGPTMRPDVSVIIPTRNRASLLREALNSVCRQRGFDGAMEIIVVDDGSSDETPDVVSTYPSAVYVRANARSASGSRNAGLKHARGEWIAFLDDDDVWLENKLHECWATIKSNPDVRFIWSHAHISGPLLNPVALWTGPDPARQPDQYVAFMENIPSISTSLVHREVFERLGGFDLSVPRIEDRELFLRILQAGFRCAVVPLPLVLYRSDASIGRWRTHGVEQLRDGYAGTVAVIRRHFGRTNPRRPAWRRQQQILWRTRGWYSHQCLAAAKEAADEGEGRIASELTRIALEISPVHVAKFWLDARVRGARRLR